MVRSSVPVTTTEGTRDLKSLCKRAFFDSDRLWFMVAFKPCLSVFLQFSIPYNGMKIPSEQDFGGAIVSNRAMLTWTTPNSNRRCFGRWDCLGQLAIFRVKYGWYMVVHVSLFMFSWSFIIPGPPSPYDNSWDNEPEKLKESRLWWVLIECFLLKSEQTTNCGEQGESS